MKKLDSYVLTHEELGIAISQYLALYKNIPVKKYSATGTYISSDEKFQSICFSQSDEEF